jgi:hypothetical protein
MKTIVFLSFLLASTTLQAQDSLPQDTLKDNELKLNVPYLIIVGYFEGSYEHILNDQTAAGLSMGIALDSDINYGYHVIPYYRVYFGKRNRAAGFFMEGSAALYSQTRESSTVDGRGILYEDATGMGLGFSLGGKFVNSSDWVFEIVWGGGRNFINTDHISEFYPRLGLSIGKRF